MTEEVAQATNFIYLFYALQNRKTYFEGLCMGIGQPIPPSQKSTAVLYSDIVLLHNR